MKKIVKISLPLIASIASTISYAGAFYVTPSLFYQHVSASHSSYNALAPRIAVGYGTMVNYYYYLGAEIFAVPVTMQISAPRQADATSAKISHSVGVSFIPGILLSDQVLGYFRLGAVGSTFSSPNKTEAGVQAGVGAKWAINKEWDIHAEYAYTLYRSLTALGTPRSNEFSIGASYQFC